MAHIHSIYDTDPHFIIDPKTRRIKNDSGKTVLVQGDHNSERFTFEIPRYVDGHDMSICDVVEVHYNNVGSADEETYSDVVDIDDLQVSPASEDVVIFSWLISGNATQYKGALDFAISFQCHDAEGNIDYELGTLTHEGITIGDRIRNSKTVIERVADILSKWRSDLFGIGKTEEAKMRAVSQEEQNAIADKGAEVLATIPADYTATSAMAEEAIRTKADGIVLSAEGESVVVNDSSNDYIRGLRVFGKSTRVTAKGYQLFDSNRLSSITQGGVTITNNANGSFNITGSGTMTSNIAKMVDYTHEETMRLLKPGTIHAVFTKTHPYVYFQIRNASTIYCGLTYSRQTFEITQEILNDPNLCIRIGIYGEANGTIEAGTVAPMVYQDGDGTWEPYTGGKASPSPEYPQEIVSVENPTIAIHSKNLIPFPYPMFACSNTDELDVTIRDDGGVLINGTPTQDSFINLCKYDFGPNHISQSTASGFVVNKHNSSILVAYDGKNKITFILVKSGTVCNNEVVYPQLEVGNVATEYEKGSGRQSFGTDRTLPGIPVTSGGNYTDANGQQWICDEIDFERGKYIQRITEKVYNGSSGELWNYIAANGVQNTPVFCVTVPGISTNPKASGRATLCDSYLHASNLPISNYEYWGESTYFGSKQFAFRNDSCVNIEEWMRYLAEHPITIMYDLATPIETPLSESELAVFRALKTNKLTTTVLNDAGAHMQLDYIADTKTYIDNQIAKRITEITNT